MGTDHKVSPLGTRLPGTESQLLQGMLGLEKMLPSSGFHLLLRYWDPGCTRLTTNENTSDLDTKNCEY